MSFRWAVKWHPGIMWHDRMPLLFHTRREARIYIDANYGYIRTRKDLRTPPHNWRLPKPVMVQVKIEEL